MSFNFLHSILDVKPSMPWLWQVASSFEIVCKFIEQRRVLKKSTPLFVHGYCQLNARSTAAANNVGIMITLLMVCDTDSSYKSMKIHQMLMNHWNGRAGL